METKFVFSLTCFCAQSGNCPTLKRYPTGAFGGATGKRLSFLTQQK